MVYRACTENPSTPAQEVQGLFCTFCRALEINPREENQSNVGRPLKIVENGRAVAEVF